MEDTAVVVGIGELGAVFARGWLRLGHPVQPVTREGSLEATARRVSAPRFVLVSVGEADLDGVLATLPQSYRSRVVLVQNELLPRDWQRHGLARPTVVVVWFEKKPGMDVKVLLPSAVFGPEAEPVAAALGALAIPARVLDDAAELHFELVRKNLYILTTNLAGLKVGGTVGELQRDHAALVEAVAGEVLDIQEWLSGAALPRERLMQGLYEAFECDPSHGCKGRSAPRRLERALDHARQAGLGVPTLSAIAREALSP